MAFCKSCGAEIVFEETPAGKFMPCNVGLVRYRKNPSGKDTVIGLRRAEVIKCDLVFDGEPDGMGRIPHWATCPFANRHRKRGKA